MWKYHISYFTNVTQIKSSGLSLDLSCVEIIIKVLKDQRHREYTIVFFNRFDTFYTQLI